MKKLSSLLLMLLLVATTAQAKFTYWGYSDKNVAGVYGKPGTKTGKAAIYIPAEVANMYKGLTVTGVRVGLASQAESLNVFVTTDLNGAYSTEQSSATANSGLNVVKFDTPYTITGDAFYVGYEYSANLNVVGCTDFYEANANYTDFGTGWVDNTKEDPTTAKALSIQMRVEGTKVPVDFALCNVKTSLAKVGETFNVSGTLLNLSASKASTFRLGYTIGNGEEEFVDINQEISERSESNFSIDCPAPNAKGKKDVRLRLVQVDGAEDAYAGNNTALTSVIAANMVMTKRAYMEEFTGIGCPWCVRGIVGIEKCQERFGSQFVAVAKHNYAQVDGLMSPTYNYTISGGFPKSIIDRRFTTDPGPDKAPTYVQAAINKGTAAYIDAFASFAEDDTTQVTATAVAQFTMNHEDSDYRFAFAVIENNVKGYQQRNAYYGSSVVMGGFEKMKSVVDIELMHVARMGLGVNTGIEGSIPSDVKANEPISYTATLTMPDFVQNHRNLKLIAILLDRNTGYVENVIEVPISAAQSTETAIADIDNTDTPVVSLVNGSVYAEGFNGKISVYTLDGKVVANGNLKPGMYIVKLTDGKHKFVQKIVF